MAPRCAYANLTMNQLNAVRKYNRFTGGKTMSEAKNAVDRHPAKFALGKS